MDPVAEKMVEADKSTKAQPLPLTHQQFDSASSSSSTLAAAACIPTTPPKPLDLAADSRPTPAADSRPTPATDPNPNPGPHPHPHLPPLPYSLHSHKRGIATTFTFLLVTASLLPLLIYFLLTRHSTLSLSLIFTIITAIPILQLLEYLRRTWLLLRPSPASRPLGAPRWSIDFYHHPYSVSVAAITCFFSLGCAYGSLALVSLPLPYLLAFVGGQMVLASALSAAGVRSPLRISSCAAGAVVRPPAFYIVEDIVAVNGHGGLEFRRAWGQRFVASRQMRRLLRDLSWFWGVPALVGGAVLVGLVAEGAVRQGEAGAGGMLWAEVVYGVCWTLPWVWAGAWAGITIWWVRGALAREKAEFEAAGGKV